MGGIIEIAMAMLRQAERRTEIAGQNIANATTPGFKRHLVYAQTATAAEDFSDIGLSRLREVRDRGGGKLFATGNAGDLSVEGSGLFAVRDGDRLMFIRSGSFRRADDGTMRDGQQHVLQTAEGTDLVVETGARTIRADGIVLQSGREIARVGVFAATGVDDQGIPRDGARPEAASGSVRQGMLEASNVSTGDEMIALMEALRRAESGQRVLQVYDALMDRVLQTERGVE
ncbi:MAG: flagellar hook basal-body protein [Proteobacteria bacterium]|nr:flagellar hook basal-body protein [Pseudomonadota bacterium]